MRIAKTGFKDLVWTGHLIFGTNEDLKLYGLSGAVLFLTRQNSVSLGSKYAKSKIQLVVLRTDEASTSTI